MSSLGSTDAVTIKIIDLHDEPAEAETPAQYYSQITREFLFGGRAYFRVQNPKNECLLYKIGMRNGRQGTQWSGEQSFFLTVYMPTTGFVYIGVVNPETGDIVPTGRSKFLRGQREFDAAEWAIKASMFQEPIATGYRIFHDGRCGRCGHALSARGDRETGFHLDCDPTRPAGDE